MAFVPIAHIESLVDAIIEVSNLIRKNQIHIGISQPMNTPAECPVGQEAIDAQTRSGYLYVDKDFLLCQRQVLQIVIAH